MTAKKVLIGCAVFAALVLALLMGSCVTAGVWLAQPGELLEPHVLVDEGTTAYAEWSLNLEDPGTRATVTKIMELNAEQTARQMEETPLPVWLQGFLSTNGREADLQNMEELFPMVLVWSMREGQEASADSHLASISIASMGNRARLADWVMEKIFRSDGTKVEVVAHGDEAIYRPVREGIPFFLRGSSVFLASEMATARWAVDSVGTSEQRLSPSVLEVDALMSGLPLGQAVRGALLNGTGELGRLLERLAPDVEGVGEGWEDVRSMNWSGNFNEAADFEFQVALTCSDTESAEALSSRLAAGAESLRDERELPLEIEVVVDGEVLRLQVRLPDLPGVLQRAVEAAEATEDLEVDGTEVY